MIRAVASGMEPIAQVYIGIATMSTAIMHRSGYSRNLMNRSSGTNAAMSAPSTSPMTSHLPMLCTIWKNP